jgi:hypothetical protein
VARRIISWTAGTVALLVFALGVIWLFRAIGAPALLAVVAAILIAGYVDRNTGSA